MTATASPRFAIYFTFAVDHPLYRKAAQWLRHCVYKQTMATVATFSPAAEKFRIVQQAAHYGFHATLKPPFRLQAGTTQSELEACVRDVASGLQAFTCSPLKVDSIGNFIALVPDVSCDDLNHLAAQCVQEFESFRAPLNETEMQKRLRSPLTLHQQALLRQWGYPFVLDEFRFHMTLTDRLPDNMINEARQQLALEFAPFLTSRLLVDRICLCYQEKRENPFYLLESYVFAAE